MPRTNKDPEDEIDDPVDDTPPEADDQATPEEVATSPSEGDGGESAPSPQPPPSFASRLGGEFADLDDDTALSRLQERLRAAEEAQSRERYYAHQAQQVQRQYEQQQAAIQQWQQQQQLAAQQQSAWKAPEFDPGWLAMVRKDADGNLVAASGADPTLPQKIQAYANWKQQQEQTFWQNPGDFVFGQIQPQLNQYVQQQVQQAIEYDRQVQAQNAWQEKYRSVLFDANGQVTPVGRRIGQVAQEIGGSNPTVAHFQAAFNSVHGELALQHARTQDPAKVKHEKDMALLQRGASQKRNRDGTFASPETNKPVNFKIPLESRMAQAFAANGIDDKDF